MFSSPGRYSACGSWTYTGSWPLKQTSANYNVLQPLRTLTTLLLAWAIISILFLLSAKVFVPASLVTNPNGIFDHVYPFAAHPYLSLTTICDPTLPALTLWPRVCCPSLHQMLLKETILGVVTREIPVGKFSPGLVKSYSDLVVHYSCWPCNRYHLTTQPCYLV